MKQNQKILILISFYKLNKNYRMEKLKKMVSKITNDSIFQQIIDSKHLKVQKCNEAIQQFSQYSSQKQMNTFTELFGIFKKQRSTKTVILTLILIDYLHSLQPQITLFHNCSEPKISKQHSIGKRHLLVNQKNFVAQEQFIKFYYEYLKAASKKTSKQLNFMSCQLNQWAQYCQISVKSILECIKIDFVFTYLLKNSQLVEQIKLCLESIFQKMSFDIKIINKFLQKNLRLVTQKHQLSFRINEIYQKMLFINSNFGKFNSITKHLNKRIDFQYYQVDKNLNKSIQIQMHERESQKIAYIINSRKQIQDVQTMDKEAVQSLTVQGQTMLRLNEFI